jgi:hypothetical protein
MSLGSSAAAPGDPRHWSVRRAVAAKVIAMTMQVIPRFNVPVPWSPPPAMQHIILVALGHVTRLLGSELAAHIVKTYQTTRLKEIGFPNRAGIMM